MKKEAFLSNSPLRSRSCSRFMPARWHFTKPPAGSSGPSSTKETRPSKKSAGKPRPSFYLAASCLALGISGYLILQPPAELETEISTLLARGWQWNESVRCANAAPGTYFEFESPTSSVEGFFSQSGRWLTALETLPEPPYQCRKISRPTFIQEVP